MRCQDISTRSFKSCKLQNGASMNQICFSRTFHSCSIRFEIWVIRRPSQYIELFVMYLNLNIFCSVAGHIILRKGATAIREYRCHEGVYLASNIVQVGDMCQSHNHMNARSVTLSLPTCLLLIVHPAAIFSPGKQRTTPSHPNAIRKT